MQRRTPHSRSTAEELPYTRRYPAPEPPNWFEAFPQQIGEYERDETVRRRKPDTLSYSKHIPDQLKAVDIVRITHDADADQFVCQQLEEFGLLNDTVTSEVFRRHDATASANALIAYLHDKDSHAGTQPESANRPNWFDTFPRQVGDHERGEMVEADRTAHLTYYRRVPDRHVPVDMVRITCEDGTYVAREQVKMHGRLRWQDTADSIVFQREADTAAVDALVQYLLDGVDPDVYHNPDPHRVWPPEDLFTADTA